MSRRRSQSNEAAVTLFPFLAVLICTMGSLIVLLVVMVQQAKMQAKREVATHRAVQPSPAPVVDRPQASAPVAQPPAGPSEADVREAELQREQLLWEIDQMQVARTQTLAAIQQQRDELSHVEDHTRRLQAEVEALQQEAKRIAALRNDVARSVPDDADKLDRLRAAVAAARDALQQTGNAGGRSSSYMIVPYDGPGGTNRRPIYIECLADRVVIQPEGIELVSADFEETTDANNALAVALRAVREHGDRAGIDTAERKPYPLLIIRPSGAASFAACRAALKGWDDEFGYELVPEGMDLTYPAVDAELKETLQVAVDASRRQQQIRSQMLAARLATKAPEGFRASRSGGFKPAEDGGLVGPSRDSGLNGVGAAGAPRGNSFPAATFSGAASTTRRTGEQTSTYPSGNANMSRSDEWSPEDTTPASPGSSTGTAFSPRTASPVGTAPAGSSPRATSGSPQGDASASTAGPPNGRVASGSAASPNYMAGMSPGEGPPSSGDSAAGQSNPNTSDGTGGPSISAKLAPVAESLGKNWAVRRGTPDSIPITRPIQVRLEGDKVVLQPERRGQRPTVFKVTESTEEVVQPLVSAVWDRIDSWGTAGATMYWKPALEISVAPQGERRYVELEALLQGSGLDWKRTR